MIRGLMAACVLSAACAAGPSPPAAIAMGQDACSHCRMAIVSQATAAQIAASGEEPRFFDDIGCLRAYLDAHPIAPGAIVYVADHRTYAWLDAQAAIFTRTSVTTPMASGLLAHADAASRDADAAARGGDAVTAASVLGSLTAGAR